MHTDCTVGGNTPCYLAGFRTTFDAHQLLGFFQIAIRFGQRFFTFHHAKAGGLAQFFHHCCGNFRHVRSNDRL